ncbi:30S ribosomal protein S17 [bacterium]|nr:30S ribosomal protein S17 [bacterium]
MGEEKEIKKRKKFEGIVVSDKMEKTVVVKVTKKFPHPLYKKISSYSKKYKVHDEKNECKIGDRVIIEECRPISKTKRWRVVKKIQ